MIPRKRLSRKHLNYCSAGTLDRIFDIQIGKKPWFWEKFISILGFLSVEEQ